MEAFLFLAAIFYVIQWAAIIKLAFSVDSVVEQIKCLENTLESVRNEFHRYWWSEEHD